MKTRWLAILLALVVGVASAIAAPKAPSILYDSSSKRFTVLFEVGAVYVCTQFENQEVLDGDKLWTVHSCGFIDDTLTRYDDEWPVEAKNQKWRVYSQVGYPRVESNGVTYVDYVTSKAVEVTY